MGIRLPFSSGYTAIATSESSDALPEGGTVGRYRPRDANEFVTEDF